MKYVKLFEDFEESQINKLKEDFDGILVELVDKGFYINYDFSKPYNRRDEVELSFYRLNGGDTSLLFDYDDVKEYIKTIKDYMDIYYDNITEVIFRNGDKNQATTNGYDRFIFGQEDGKSAKFNNLDPILKKTRTELKFWFIRLNFKIKNKK
jgi:hypothetical protein